jgi:hypothetical protein
MVGSGASPVPGCAHRGRATASRDRRLRRRHEEGSALEVASAELLTVVLGLGLVVLGAVGATVATRRVEASGRWTLLPLQLLPFGVLVGAGAAIVRGWDLAVAMLAGAVVIPIVGVGGRWLELRRRRRSAR